jgi:hypothetical protein
MANDLVTVATFLNTTQAALAKSRLESEGVQTFLADEHIVSTDWLLSTAVGGVRVQVESQNTEKAIEILNSESISNDELISVAENYEGDPSEFEGTEDDFEEKIINQCEDPPLTQREMNADRAYRGAIIGLVWPLAIPFVFVTLLKIFISNDKLRPSKRRKAIIAAILNIPLMILICYFSSGFIGLLFRIGSSNSPAAPSIPPLEEYQY